MPQKSSARPRSKEKMQRAWGTRFDSLTTSPTSPTLSSNAPSPVAGAPPAQLAHALDRDIFCPSAGSINKRDWADDDVPATLVAIPSPSVDTLAGATRGYKDTSTVKMPHNASVFIGYLPPDEDEGEMAQLLAQHLAQFASIQNIKIIHDSKGGACAFVQCENAAQAALVVSRAQSNPQPFMGRYLRYEIARAFRSLWISYCTPMHFVPCTSEESEATGFAVDDYGVKGRWAESDLPDALRIWKPRDARYPIVSFKSEARNVIDVSQSEGDSPTPEAATIFDTRGILFSDLKFDAETIRKMAAAFGPLESFGRYLPPTHAFGEEPCSYPPGHDSSRSTGMDQDVWEVKWGHRDDCICALTTLRRVPHLTVTWANVNHSNYPPTPRQAGSRQSFSRPPISPRYPYSYSPRGMISPVAHSRPLLLDRFAANDSLRGMDGLSSPVFNRTLGGLHVPRDVLPSSPTVRGRRGKDLVHPGPLTGNGDADTEEGWTVVRQQNITRTILSSITGVVVGQSDAPDAAAEISEETGEGKVLTRSPNWSDRDFPPLRIIQGGLGEAVGKNGQREETLAEPTIKSLHEITNPAGNQVHSALDDVSPDDSSSTSTTSSLPRPLVLRRRSSSNPVARLQTQGLQSFSEDQSLEFPPTPELADTSLSHTPTSAQPTTPMYPSMIPLTTHDPSSGQEFANHERKEETDFSYRHEREREVDPKTVFVGGLEPFGPITWDENRLRAIFQRYGEVQEVRIINTSAKKTSFAFVTFSDEESSLRAIRVEHNRNYDGRQIRVQLRDMNPSRGGFRFRSRGMGRPRHYGFEPHVVEGDSGSGFERQMERNTLRPSKTYDIERANVPFRIDTDVHQHLISSLSGGTDSATLLSSNSYEVSPEVDRDVSRESDTRTAVSLTPPPSAPGVSVSTTNIVAPTTPQSVPPASVSYYPPHTWASPFGAPMHYPIPFGAYGGMIPPVPMQYAAAVPSTDASGQMVNAPLHWGPIYRTAIPYAPYPYISVMPTSETPRSAAVGTSQPPTPVKEQPPLHATGFIQGEHGTLIPVYQPEALSEYMSGSSSTPNQILTHTSATPAASAAPPSSVQQPQTAMPGPIWSSGYPPPQHLFSYPIPPTIGVASPASPPTTAQQQMIHQQIHGQALQPPVSASWISPGVATTTHMHTSQQHTSMTAAQGVSSQFYANQHVNAGPTMPVINPHGGLYSGRAPAGISERQNAYASRHPPRRDQSAFYVRSGPGTLGGARSPSGNRLNSRSSSTPRMDHHQNNASASTFTQRSGRGTHPQLGFNNKHISDGGPSHHQWIAQHQHHQ